MRHFHLIVRISLSLALFDPHPNDLGIYTNFYPNKHVRPFLLLCTCNKQTSIILSYCMIFNWECMSSNIFFLKFLQDIFGRMPMLLSSVSLEWSCWPHYCHSNISLSDIFSCFKSFSFNSWISHTIMCMHLDFLTFVLFPPRTTIDHFACNEILYKSIVEAGVIHSGENMSNHSAIY